MAIRVNPKLIDELETYGAQDVSKCYHCGNCSATCPFSKGDTVFPRRAMRMLQMGLESQARERASTRGSATTAASAPTTVRATPSPARP